MPNAISKHRFAAFQHQNGRCHYCGLPMWLKHPEELNPNLKGNHRALSRLRCTAEHLLARQDGGANSRANIVAACHFCNMTRHRITNPPDPARYREHVRHRVRAGKWHSRNVHQLVASAHQTANPTAG